jgi:hypothetical protein
MYNLLFIIYFLKNAQDEVPCNCKSLIPAVYVASLIVDTQIILSLTLKIHFKSTPQNRYRKGQQSRALKHKVTESYTYLNYSMIFVLF